MAVVTGVRLLHKRYTTAQWDTGTAPYVLYQGEFGINSDTGEVRGYTYFNSNSGDHVTWASATSLGTIIETEAGEAPALTNNAEVVTSILESTEAGTGKKYYKVTKGKLPGISISEGSNSEDLESTDADTFVSNVVVDSSDAHKLQVTRKKIPSSSLTITGGGTEDVVVEVDGAQVIKLKYVLDTIDGSSSNGHTHSITRTETAVTTSDYVDSRKFNLENNGLETAVTGGAITFVDPTGFSVENSDGNHTLKYKTRTYTTPGASGTIGETSSNTEKNVVTGFSLGYDETAKLYKLQNGKEKELVSNSSNELTITGTDTQIQFSLDLSAYATKADIQSLSGAMVFKGTLNATTTVTLSSAIESVNAGGGTNPVAGDTYKFITNTGTYTGASFITSDGSQVSSITPDKGDIITYSGQKWYLIPSGDEADGTVTAIEEGTGIDLLNTDGTDTTSITSTGKIAHKTYSDYTSNINWVSGGVTNNDNDENYTFIENLKLDKDGLGHVISAQTKEVTIPKWDKIEETIKKNEHITTVSSGNHITVSTGASTTTADGETVTPYTINHAALDTTTTNKTKVTAQQGTGRTYVTGVYRDAYGHISHVETATETVTDTNTWRPIKAQNSPNASGTTIGDTAEDFLSGGIDTGALTLIGGENITLLKATDGQLIIKTLGKATVNNYGFFKPTKSISTAHGSRNLSSGASNSVNYGLQIDKDGYGFVTVDDPMVDRHHTPNSNIAKNLGFYAFSCDDRGHITYSEAITVLDGNDSKAGDDSDTATENKTA